MAPYISAGMEPYSPSLSMRSALQQVLLQHPGFLQEKDRFHCPELKSQVKPDVIVFNRS